MERDPIGSDARRASRARKLGPDAVCVLCGDVDPALLLDISVAKVKAELDAVYPRLSRLFEMDHVVGRAHDPNLTLALCRNCHWKIGLLRMAGHVSMRPAPTSIERNLMILRAFEVLFPKLGTACSRMAGELERQVAGMDQDTPGWRKKAWAK